MSEPQPVPVPPYAAPVYGGPAPKDLVVPGVLAFASATAATLTQVAHAAVVGPAVRHGGDLAELDDWAYLASTFTSLVGLLALLASWITGSIWLHRARRNAELLAPTYPHRRSAGWAWGGWVCPVVNFWFPFQVVRDAHRAVRPDDTSPVFGWWWGLWVAVTVVERFAERVETRAMASATNADSAAGTATFLAVLMALALVGWGLVLRRVTTGQRERLLAAY
jgi:hypothetical protein